MSLQNFYTLEPKNHINFFFFLLPLASPSYFSRADSWVMCLRNFIYLVWYFPYFIFLVWIKQHQQSLMGVCSQDSLLYFRNSNHLYANSGHLQASPLLFSVSFIFQQHTSESKTWTGFRFALKQKCILKDEIIILSYHTEVSKEPRADTYVHSHTRRWVFKSR